VSASTAWTFGVMTRETRAAAGAVLRGFLREDEYYLASSGAYGDGGDAALERALDLFLAQPALGVVWLAFEHADPVAACVVCFAISTARGGIVAKLDDVSVDVARRGSGIGTAMLNALAAWLRQRQVSRIDCGCHRDNAGAWRFYERLGFQSLHEERIAWLLE
jgi:ribosomal protein S18 acetylase RimI-like enzyme